MSSVFNSISVKRPKRSKFDLSYDVKLTMNMGDLVPVHVQEVVPGDSFEIGCQSLIRFAPLIAPVMHRMDVYTHYFFVPNRILWNEWETFITGSRDGKTVPEDNIPAFPVFDGLNSPLKKNNRLADYLGLPVTGNNLDGLRCDKVSVLPFAAYQAIWNDYYRDQNLQDAIEYKVLSGDNSARWSNVFSVLRKRAWRHDYFTSCLPFAQKGDAVALPVIQPQADLPVYNSSHVHDHDGTNASWTATVPSGTAQIDVPNATTSEIPENYLYVEGDDIQENATTVNDLRTAFRLQEWLEKAARAGSRYFENIQAFFGVRSPDSRLQRPEYIGGSKNPVVISEVLQTSQTDETPQANMAGHGISFDKGGYSRFSAQEHGYIIGIMSVLPTTAYQQGIPRHFSKFDRYDYLWPDFAHLGEQEVLNKEVYNDVTDGNNEKVFGYIPRYSEYRYNPSRVSGDFRGNLDFWHLGRKFAVRPNLNESFIASDPTSRVFAVTDNDTDHLYVQVFHTINAYRPLPKYGTPFGI